jgi:hypothetical protein
LSPRRETIEPTSGGGGVLTIALVTIWTIYFGSSASGRRWCFFGTVKKAATAAQWTSPETNEMRTWFSSAIRWHCSMSLRPGNQRSQFGCEERMGMESQPLEPHQLRSCLWSVAVQWSERSSNSSA